MSAVPLGIPLILSSTVYVNPITVGPLVVNYYIDAEDGNDGNNGLSAATAWQTVAPLNWTGGIAGRTVGFRRGQTHQMTVWGLPRVAGIDVNHKTVYTAYGRGEKPILQGALQSFSGPWTEDRKSVV